MLVTTLSTKATMGYVVEANERE